MFLQREKWFSNNGSWRSRGHWSEEQVEWCPATLLLLAHSLKQLSIYLRPYIQAKQLFELFMRLLFNWSNFFFPSGKWKVLWKQGRKRWQLGVVSSVCSYCVPKWNKQQGNSYFERAASLLPLQAENITCRPRVFKAANMGRELRQPLTLPGDVVPGWTSCPLGFSGCLCLIKAWEGADIMWPLM